MAGFSAHVDQAIHNCKTLKSINQNVPDSWDWQVTTAFYTAVHLVNGHMAKIANHHYKSHVSVKQALFCGKDVAVPERIYLSYVKLESLSRRARYLCNESPDKSPEQAHITYEIHLAKAIRHLDVVAGYLCKLHGISLEKYELNCKELNSDKLNFFLHKPESKAA
ncbi:hypothetical protein [Pedobacter nyackensis]|uniref:HEPN domain-containing protein n=1 Tax=Pedobacter nyackensis TaxID=475255 RepID=A0A1W2DS14_9SPHI|nr:hypothetical protein [Pedobacter nyackensis]SMD00173.1 hypothetical protein SAMN04488101_1085 [Pedobacter nyackensis]